MTTTSAPPHCDANASGRAATDWGMDYLPCQTRVGLRSFIDAQGLARRYCAAPDHRANVERRFGKAPDACRFCKKPNIGEDWHTFDDHGALFTVCGPCLDKADLDV